MTESCESCEVTTHGGADEGFSESIVHLWCNAENIVHGQPLNSTN
ncbi:hypothetical protein SAMN04489740_2892 [Arthrobacter alpinus]|uniref:Uncharacterized protein n=1 Tax=Arthrobacter alpinus TaxID=656366 RepID=A0A1H5MEM5_9MICC|nr:hypothetical protein SAMN04489740_2892 [Arthrobacter alpinus]